MEQEHSRTWSLGWRAGYYSLTQDYAFENNSEFAAFHHGKLAGQAAYKQMFDLFGHKNEGLIERSLAARTYRKKRGAA